MKVDRTAGAAGRGRRRNVVLRASHRAPEGSSAFIVRIVDDAKKLVPRTSRPRELDGGTVPNPGDDHICRKMKRRLRSRFSDDGAMTCIARRDVEGTALVERMQPRTGRGHVPNAWLQPLILTTSIARR